MIFFLLLGIYPFFHLSPCHWGRATFMPSTIWIMCAQLAHTNFHGLWRSSWTLMWPKLDQWKPLLGRMERGSMSLLRMQRRSKMRVADGHLLYYIWKEIVKLAWETKRDREEESWPLACTPTSYYTFKPLPHWNFQWFELIYSLWSLCLV